MDSSQAKYITSIQNLWTCLQGILRKIAAS